MPIVPPAPVRFSMTICWLIARDIASPTTRATKSSPPPGASGTMKRTGRLGHSVSEDRAACARAALGRSAPCTTPPRSATAPPAALLIKVRLSMFDTAHLPSVVDNRRLASTA
ncbi:MAG: hypothetical protein AUI16_02060 [Alphaproteobacteria bacterium 13_2_20CM_2_64_7]|nr:MAG: hypothetical protein AUI16_02060 [Alphaproteobacteria bacterium 13_2_20CM_2_64_7]